MRHQKKKKILDRKKAPREMMLRNLAASILLYEKVQTTQAKAKAVKPLVEKLISISKENNLITKRKLVEILPQKLAIKKLLEVLGERYKDKNSGYTRIVKLNTRSGDGAAIVQIELI